MAHNEIIVLLAVLAAYVFTFFAGRFSLHNVETRGYDRGWNAAKQVYYIEAKEHHSEKERSAYLLGWEDAKKAYYTDVREERLMEEERQMRILEEANAKINEENKEFLPISSDLLMAYGVNTIGQLPKSIREQYGLREDQNSIDLDTLIKLERGERAE